MTAIEVPWGRRVHGEVRIPPSKSATNRALNLALLAGREITVERPLAAADTEAFLTALETLGTRVERRATAVRLVPGRSPARALIDCGASGTMARFLTASLAALPGAWRLDGTARLRDRPLGPLLTALRSLGARIECEAREGHLPLAIEGTELTGGGVQLDAGESSQYLSALLMAATRAAAPVRIEVTGLTSAPYVELTVEAMERFGARVDRPGPEVFAVAPGLTPPPVHSIEGDMSAACYFAAAAALTGGRVELAGLGRETRQGDRRFLEILGRMGARVEWPRSDRLVVSAGEGLLAVEVDMGSLPDQVPTLAAIAPFAAGTSRIRNVSHLRIKESDRLAACAAELQRAGASVEETPDGLVVPGVWSGQAPPAAPIEIATHDDHRIAMSFALLGLGRPGVRIAEPGVVAKSYPSFWEDLEHCLTD